MTHHLVAHDLARCTLLSLPEEVDFANAGALYEDASGIVDARSETLDALILDLTATSFIDTSALELIASVKEHAWERSRAPLRVAARTPQVCRLLDMVHIRRDVPVYDDLAEALLGGPASFPR
ncbi:STAS domain-containing protein [Streptomyces sp. MST-110588]|uniref:STAS domain-containing protein n=1 Tax=Streptomyces sp. MST-110588 TaxID=2833628 RepID=UPI001F5D171B|nr:STAS domain-containing protein [Streptomyces sp. MST-110588]UNO40842.1 STAS domain-containing protein [Streptomyces sp. MST-110588]